MDFLHAFNICQVFLHIDIVFDGIFPSIGQEAILSLEENCGLKISLSRFKLTISKERWDQALIDLIQSHYKCLETFSKLVPHAWIAITDVKDLTYAVSKCTYSNI